MRHFIIAVTFFLSTTLAQAYNPISAEPEEAYSVIPIVGDPYVERSYLGDLDGVPDLYEFKTEVAITLRVQIRQRAGREAVPFGLILVRQNDMDGGVTEIARQNEVLQNWGKERSHLIGVKFLSAPILEKEITPGTYRIEVSTPDNIGNYSLTTGEESEASGYFKSLSQIARTQYHFGLTPIYLLFSSYVYGTLVILVLGYSGYRFRSFKQVKYEHYN